MYQDMNQSPIPIFVTQSSERVPGFQQTPENFRGGKFKQTPENFRGGDIKEGGAVIAGHPAPWPCAKTKKPEVFGFQLL
jgi:hypothetical protein